ncbi:hypothetical protein BJ546DRAFT_511679 [Cryomyces antarcticus]
MISDSAFCLRLTLYMVALAVQVYGGQLNAYASREFGVPRLRVSTASIAWLRFHPRNAAKGVFSSLCTTGNAIFTVSIATSVSRAIVAIRRRTPHPFAVRALSTSPIGSSAGVTNPSPSDAQGQASRSPSPTIVAM